VKTLPPSIEVISAFGLSGIPVLLSGGQGESFRVDNAVLKPAGNIEETSWIAELNTRIVNNKFRVLKPIQARNGSWVVNGWAANKYVEGKHKTGNYSDAIQVSNEFHNALKNIPKPSFFDHRNNVWAVADRIAWSEQPFPDFALTNRFFREVSSLLIKNELPNQLIHGDWGLGNILFDKDDIPVVIDFSPYYRPIGFAVAIMIVDALAYGGAKPSVVDLCSNIKQFDQLLIRALTRRICENIGHHNHPDNTQDRTKDVKIHLKIFDALFKKK